MKENLETCSRKEIDSLFISETVEHGDPRGSHAGTEPVGLLPPYLGVALQRGPDGARSQHV